jgi:formate hydrogenlyase subunit 4
MSLVNIIISLIAVGVILWLINTLIPMDGKIKQILNGVIVIVVVIWLLQVFGVVTMLSTIHVGK